MTSVRGVTGYELARMRQNAELHGTTRIHVYRRSEAADGRGGQTVTETRVASYTGRKAPLTTVQSVEQVYADRLGGNQGWWFTFPAHARVRLTDKLVSSSRNYEVVGFDTDRHESISVRVLCRELT